jgi:type IV secretion system protein TrbE
MEVSEQVNTNSGDESEGLFAGFIEYKNLFILLGGLALTLVLTLAIWHNRHVAPAKCFVVGSLPLLITCLWVFGFRQGKPKAHDRDLLQTAIKGMAWQQDPIQPDGPIDEKQPRPTKFAPAAPNGWICDGLIVWGSIRKGGYTSKGFVLDVPSQSQSSPAIRNSLNAAIRRFLHTLDEQTRAQLCWSVDSDYKDALASYHQTTGTMRNKWSQHVRKERYNRYFKAMIDGTLRRERLVLYISRPITVDPPVTLSGDRLLKHYEQVLAEENQAYEQNLSVMRSLFDACGCRITPMDDAQHYRHLVTAINPSLAKRFGYDPLDQFVPSLSIQDNIWNGGHQGSSKFGFFYDGYFHNLVLLKRPPQRTHRGILEFLTNLPFLDYAITVNLYPLSVKQEILRSEQSLERVRSSYAASGKHRLLTSKTQKEDYISALSQGDAYPFKWEFVVRVWDESEAGLLSKTRQIEAAINKMDAQHWTTNQSSPATTRNMWCQTWPGWIWGSYTQQAHIGVDSWLADLLPFSSSFTGHLDAAEALYDGPNGSLVGVRTFINETPQLAVVLGMTRSGKSVFMTDFLSQIAPYYDFMLLLEEGLSYGIFTEANGSKPIIVHPDGTLCINYLDTNGGPLSNLHIDMAASLVCKLVGTTPDPEKSQLRKAQVRAYINQLYDDYFAQWCNDHRNELPGLTRLTIAAHRYKLFLPSDSTFVEAWTELRHLLASNNDRAQTILSEITEAEISRWLKEPGTARTVRNCLFATFTPEQYPQHPDLHDMMQNHPLPEHDSREIADLATLLEPWNEQALVSGASTIRFTQNGIAHFELGQIPDANMHLKEIAAFLIANYARQHIITIPRSKRKLVLFEECARTLNIPGGQELVSEFYAQLSKFSTEIISSVQSYSMFRNSPIRPVVMGNAAIKFLCKFADRNDLDDIATDIGLSEAAKETVLRYPRPDHLPPGKQWAGVTYHHLDAQNPVCGTMINSTSPSVAYASSSTGKDFDERQRVLRTYPNIIDGIIQESQTYHKP